jgi:hypothetical protein
MERAFKFLKRTSVSCGAMGEGGGVSAEDRGGVVLAEFRPKTGAVWCFPAKKQASRQRTVSLRRDEAGPLGPTEETPSRVKETTRNELRKNGKRSYH